MTGQWSGAKKTFVDTYIASGFTDEKGAAKAAGVSVGVGEAWLQDRRVAAYIKRVKAAISDAVDAAHALAADLAAETGLPIESRVQVTVRRPERPAWWTMTPAQLRKHLRKQRAKTNKLAKPADRV